MIKLIFSIAILLFAPNCFGRSQAESAIQNVSNQTVRREVQTKIDSLETLFSDELKIITSRGEMQTKEQYPTTLHNKCFRHDCISAKQTFVTIAGKYGNPDREKIVSHDLHRQQTPPALIIHGSVCKRSKDVEVHLSLCACVVRTIKSIL